MDKRSMIWPMIRPTPERIQLDPIECGAVCLGIVLEYYGNTVSNAELKRAADISRNGSDAASLIIAAEGYGLRATAKRALASDLRGLKPPSILFFDDCHFVVYEGYALGKFYINDPARGRYALDELVFHRRFSRVAIELVPMPTFLRAGRQKKRAWPLPVPKKIALMALGAVAALISAIFAGGIGFMMIEGTRASVSAPLWTLALVLPLLWALLAFLALRRMAVALARHRCEGETSGLWADIGRLPMSSFDDLPLTSLADAFSSSFHRALSWANRSIKKYFLLSSAVILIGILAMLSPWFGVLAMLALSLKICAMAIERHGRKRTLVTDAFFYTMLPMGHADLLIEKRMLREVELLCDEGTGHIPPMARKTLLFGIFIVLFVIIARWALWSGELLLEQILSAELLFLALILSLNALRRKRRLPSSAEALADELLSAKANPIVLKVESPGGPLIKLMGVDISYPGQQVFSGLDMELLRGKVYGLCGAPLAGTSTLLRLLGKKLGPDKGEVIHFLRDKKPLAIAAIDDDAHIYAGTLKEVLTLLDARIREADLVMALKNADATSLFYGRSRGLLTFIDEDGINLSRGERNRLLLAQALVHKPDLVLLDDFFDPLLHRTAVEIIGNLKSLGTTTIFNSYKESGLALADRVIFITAPTRVIMGDHGHLLKQEPAYRSLLTDVGRLE